MRLRAWSSIAPWVIAGLASMGCGGTVLGTQSDAGLADQQAAAETSGLDVASSREASPAEVGAPAEAAPPEAGLPGCHAITGSGPNLQCTYESPASGACGPGEVAGPCPSAGLFGCCLSCAGADSGVAECTPANAKSATCYYAATTGDKARTNCESMAYEHTGAAWSVASP